MKSHILRYTLALATAIGLCSVASADHHKKPVDLVGVWNVTAKSDDGERKLTWTIKKAVDKLTGISKDLEDDEERNLDRIKIEEKKVTIEIDFERDGNTGIVKVVAEEKKAGELTGKWSIEDSAGTEYMSGDLTAIKEIKIAYAGDWKATTVLPDGNEMTAAMILKGKNSELKGGFTSDGGELEIDKIKAEERTLRLEFDMEIEGNPIDVVIEADLKEENKLVGKWAIKAPEGQEAPSGDWSAVREPKPDYSGVWNVTAKVPDSDDYSGTLTLTKDGDNYAGESQSSGGDERKLKSVKIDGKKIVFVVELEQGEITITSEENDEGNLVGKWSLTTSEGAEYGDEWKASRKVDTDKGSGVIEGR